MTDNFDFSQLKSLKTPDRWIETAVMIPHRKKTLPFILRPSVIGTAASLVIAVAAVLTLLLSSGGEPIDNDNGLIVRHAATVPTETIGETKASDEGIATHDASAITDDTAPQASGSTEMTSASGEVISAQPVPVAPSSATGANATNPTTKPTVAETTASAISPDTTTQPPVTEASETTATKSDVPAFEDVTDPPEENETDPHEKFTGKLTLKITPDSPLFGSDFVTLDFFDESGNTIGSTFSLYPRLNKAGYKSVMIAPDEYGITLYRWQSYTLNVSDTNGNGVTTGFTPSFAGGVTVRL